MTFYADVYFKLQFGRFLDLLCFCSGLPLVSLGKLWLVVSDHNFEKLQSLSRSWGKGWVLKSVRNVRALCVTMKFLLSMLLYCCSSVVFQKSSWQKLERDKLLFPGLLQ